MLLHHAVFILFMFTHTPALLSFNLRLWGPLLTPLEPFPAERPLHSRFKFYLLFGNFSSQNCFQKFNLNQFVTPVTVTIAAFSLSLYLNSFEYFMVFLEFLCVSLNKI